MVRGMVHDHALSNLVYATISNGVIIMVVASLCVDWCVVWCMTMLCPILCMPPLATV